MSTELDFCVHLLVKFRKFWETNKAPYLEIFLDPVDEVEDHAPGYYAEIGRPMDLATMDTKLGNGAYADALAFKADFDLMIQNCRTYNKDNPEIRKKYADRFAREFEWEWSEMGRWMSTRRRKLAREAAAPASAPSATAAAPTTSTSGNGSSSSLRLSASNAEPENSSRPSPRPSLGSPQGNGMAIPRPSASNTASASKRGRQDAEEDVDDEETPKRVRVNDSSEDAVDVAVGALRGIMTEQIAVVAAEKAELAARTLPLWGKVWEPERHQASTEIWRAKCFSKITREEWPGSVAAIRNEIQRAWAETVAEQLAVAEQEERAAKAAERAKFLRQLDKHSITMPPKQFNTKASKAHSDSAYEDSEPEPQALRKPRITLKRRKSALNMNETDIPIHSHTRVRKPSPDQIYKDLLSRPAANEPAQDQIYKDLLSRPAANEPAPKRQRVSLASTSSVNMAASASSATIAGKSRQDRFNDYTKDLVSEEIEKQAEALDFSRDSGLSSKARVYGQFLFTAPYQFERTKTTWMDLAMQRVDAMSMAELRNGGIETAVKDALIQTIGDETKNQAVLFGHNARDIIRMLKKED
ncbi:hypothetical protein KCU71_g3481, partial [Aureobasidium melanogenum]